MTAPISEALAIALQHHRAGRLAMAEEIYRQILQADPNHADAWHLLGVTAYQLGRHQIAVEQISQAIRLDEGKAEFHNDLGVAYQASGQLCAAIAAYERAIQIAPEYADACYNLGNALRTQGELAKAIACYQRTVQLQPGFAAGHNNLGNALKDQGHLAAAVASYEQALRIAADFAEAHCNLGIALQAQGRLAEAIACYRRALQLDPALAAAHNNLGSALKDQGQLDEAVACCQRAIQIQPNRAEAHSNLGLALEQQGELDQAIACYQRAIQIDPQFAQAHCNLGNALRSQGQSSEALACYRRAIQADPEYAEAYSILGLTLQQQGQLDEAIACCQRALQIKPEYAAAWNNLGNSLKDQGLRAEALTCYQRALQIRPDLVAAHSNLVYTLHFCPEYSAARIHEEHRRWSQLHAAPLAARIQRHANDRSPDRRLRIGYISPDFRGHPVSRFLLPLLESHDHVNFEIFCYASVPVPDAVTDRCRAQADVWRNVSGHSDATIAETIRQDRIDILVDLTMHMADNRLLVFARKPAPVQVTYLAYSSTTGMDTMDYRLTDPYLDAPGQDERFYSEQSIRLPETYWCYQPISAAPPVNALPALQTGYVSFGCLNNFCKVTEPTLAAWSRVLHATPESRLLLHAHAGSHRERVRGFFADHGVSPDRLTFIGGLPSEQYLRVHHRLDVALDPFPYGGGTTTCDALWMGVPVISLVGQMAVGRAGLSILSNVGLAELLARDVDEYVQIAVDLAHDLQRLGQLRASLRDRMLESPLMDAPRFARNVEAAYRSMWRRWCQQEGPKAEIRAT